MKHGIPFLVLAVFAGLSLMQSPSASEPKKGSYTIDGVHSSALFRVQHFHAGAFYGRFNKISGTFTVGGSGSVSVTVAAGSVDTGNSKRDGHLKSPDFFNAKQFPNITFKSRSLEKVGPDRYEAKGTFSMHGVSKEITVPVTHVGSGKRKGKTLVGMEAIFTVKRSDFGMKYMLGPVGDEVRLIVSVEGAG